MRRYRFDAGQPFNGTGSTVSAVTRLGVSLVLWFALATLVTAQNPPIPIPQPPLPGQPPIPQPKPQPKPTGKAPPTRPTTKPSTAKPPTAKRGPAKPEPEEEPPPPPESIILDTKDGWKIHCVYYRAKDSDTKGKEVIPLLMVHGWEGQGGEYSDVAKTLQRFGYSSLVPDLRGHGRSTKRVGDSEEYDFEDLKPADVQLMWYDLEAAKSFLLSEHNAGRVNIELLGVIGAELGAIVSMKWAATDWSWPQPVGYKQGQDVRALVLLSPEQSFMGMKASSATNPRTDGRLMIGAAALRSRISVLIAAGADDRRAYSDAKRVAAPFENARPREQEKPMRERDYIFVDPPLPTVLQGTDLLDPRVGFRPWLFGFLKYRLAERSDEFPWKERKSPLGG